MCGLPRYIVCLDFPRALIHAPALRHLPINCSLPGDSAAQPVTFSNPVSAIRNVFDLFSFD